MTVDGESVEIPKGATVLHACDTAGIDVPRFCYHQVRWQCGRATYTDGGLQAPSASCTHTQTVARHESTA